MLKSKTEISVIIAVALAGILGFSYWMIHDPVEAFSVSMPGMDNRPARKSGTAELVRIGEHFNHYADQSSVLKGKWTRFRGAGFDNINKEDIPLINSFGPAGPDIQWQVDLGEGHAAPVIYNGMVYLLDYDEESKEDALRCFSLETGEELWRRSYQVHVKRNHGMSRTVPAITDDYIVSVGPRGHVMCLDRKTGDYLWGRDLVREYGTEIPFWYTGQCPLIDDGIAIIAPGGASLITGFNCETGMVEWETPNADHWKMSHSSIMPMTFAGKKMYVYAAIGGVCGISAEEEDRGKMLWKSNAFSPNVMAPSPLVMDNGMIFLTAGYGAGAMLIQLTEDGGQFMVRKLQKYKPKDGVASEQQTPIFYDGHMFIILPKDAGAMRNQFVCVKPDDCTKILWTSSKSERYGLGPYILADRKFFILSDDGTLSIVLAATSGFKLLDKAQVIEGQDAWGPIAIADGRLLMRDSKQMVCLDMRANPVN